MARPTFSFQWHLLDDCDQRCKHCYIFSGDEAVELNRMSLGQMQQTLANIEDFCETFGREPYLYITGGDPILHPDFWTLMEILKDKGIEFTVMGNPFHLTDEVCARLRECGCLRYQMSIDGARETHDWFRKPGSYDETLARIPMLARAGIRSIIMTTVSNVNAHELPQIIDAVVEAGADVFAFSRYVPTPGENMEGLSPEEYREVLDAAHKKFKAYEDAGCKTYFNRKDHLWRLYEWEEGIWSIPDGVERGVVYDGCNCGSGHLTVLPTGDVYACRRVEGSKVGNALEERLADIWLGPMEDYRQTDEFSKCGRCELLAWCRGCPAVARGTDGSFYGEDPQCWHEVPADAAPRDTLQLPRRTAGCACAAAGRIAAAVEKALEGTVA